LEGEKNGGELMKTTDTLKHHREHKYTLTGLWVGGMLMVVSLVNFRVLNDPRIDPLSIYITLVPGIALILRSLRPPIGIIRVFTVLTGGALIGAVPILFAQEVDLFKWAGTAAGLIGAGLLGASFTLVVKIHHHTNA
jgi:hypothetical protein